MSLDTFYSRRTLVSARSQAKFTTSPAITFVDPTETTLHQHLTTILGMPPTAQQEAKAAWWLGLWLADGDAIRPYISQGGPPRGQRLSHTEVFDELLRFGGHASLFPVRGQLEAVTQRLLHHRRGAHPVYSFHWHVQSVFGQLLRLYGMLHNKHVPDAMCDSTDVRWSFLAGLMDGDGHFAQRDNVYEISAKDRQVCEDYQMLARTLGMRACDWRLVRQYDADFDQWYDGYRISLSGQMWRATQYCVLSYKRTAGIGNPRHRPWENRAYAITTVAAPGGRYTSFDIDAANRIPLPNNHVAVMPAADKRFLLADFTITA